MSITSLVTMTTCAALAITTTLLRRRDFYRACTVSHCCTPFSTGLQEESAKFALSPPVVEEGADDFGGHAGLRRPQSNRVISCYKFKLLYGLPPGMQAKAE